MVTITASITTAEIAEAMSIPPVVAKTIIQRMFNMNFFRNFPDEFKFFVQAREIQGNREVYSSKDSMLIGLRRGETDGTKAAILAYIEKAAPSHVDLSPWPKKVEPAPTTEPE